MSRQVIHDDGSSNETDRFLAGRKLIERIRSTPDFPVAEAHSINRRSWSDEASYRFDRFNIKAETGGIRSFFKNPWIKPEGPLLDIACSTGHNLAYFGKRGIEPLYGIDISLPLLKLAKKRLRRAHVQQADMIALPFRSNYFKTVIARGALHNTTTRGFLDALMEIHRVLRDDGVLYLRRRYRPANGKRYTHFALHTYVGVDDEGKTNVVRNFLPPMEMWALLESIGFKLVGDAPMTLIKKRRYPVKAGGEGAQILERALRGEGVASGDGKKRYSVECICTKKAMS